MPERKFKLTSAQLSELWRAYAKAPDGATKARYQAVRLYGTDYPLQTVIDVIGCSISRLREWVRAYRTEGVDALMDHRIGGNSAKLTPGQRDEIEARLREFTPHQILGSQTYTPTGQFWTVEDLQVALHRWYGVEYQSRISYYNLLHACGFSYQRTEKVFKSQRVTEIAAFQELVEKN